MNYEKEVMEFKPKGAEEGCRAMPHSWNYQICFFEYDQTRDKELYERIEEGCGRTLSGRVKTG